jgi:hypothetical protein
MSTLKINRFLIYFVSSLLLLQLANAYYGLMIVQENLGLTPLYGLWTESVVSSVLIIIILVATRFYVIAYLWLIAYTINYFIEAKHFTTNNPIVWLHLGKYQPFIGLSLAYLVLVFSIIALAIWIKLKFYKGK